MINLAPFTSSLFLCYLYYICWFPTPICQPSNLGSLFHCTSLSLNYFIRTASAAWTYFYFRIKKEIFVKSKYMVEHQSLGQDLQLTAWIVLNLSHFLNFSPFILLFLNGCMSVCFLLCLIFFFFKRLIFQCQWDIKIWNMLVSVS